MVASRQRRSQVDLHSWPCSLGQAFGLMHGDRHLVVSAAPRIIGGGQHDAFTSPFVVRLYDASSAPSGSIGFCGGALIAPRSVLTAAHCVSETSTRRTTRSRREE